MGLSASDLESAASVWKSWDGQTTVSEINDSLRLKGMSRRQMIGTVGLAAAAIPLITSINRPACA
jgi:hypothetical protein